MGIATLLLLLLWCGSGHLILIPLVATEICRLLLLLLLLLLGMGEGEIVDPPLLLLAVSLLVVLVLVLVMRNTDIRTRSVRDREGSVRLRRGETVVVRLSLAVLVVGVCVVMVGVRVDEAVEVHCVGVCGGGPAAGVACVAGAAGVAAGVTAPGGRGEGGCESQGCGLVVVLWEVGEWLEMIQVGGEVR